jgi:hypothetical protein
MESDSFPGSILLRTQRTNNLIGNVSHRRTVESSELCYFPDDVPRCRVVRARRHGERWARLLGPQQCSSRPPVRGTRRAHRPRRRYLEADTGAFTSGEQELRPCVPLGTSEAWGTATIAGVTSPATSSLRSSLGARDHTSLPRTVPEGRPLAVAPAGPTRCPVVVLPQPAAPTRVSAVLVRRIVHGQVMSAHATVMMRNSTSRYHGQGPSRSRIEGLSGLPLRKP